MATITGIIDATDTSHQATLVGSDLRVGSIYALDKTHEAFLSGVIIQGSTKRDRGKSFVQDTLLTSTDLSLYLRDSTYIDGSWSGDGTFFDSTYWEPRPFNPIWINYSIWYLTPPTESPDVLQGYRLRTATNNMVGQFYANMYAPDTPGRYEIRWRYQKDQSSLGHEIVEPFSVTTWGLDPQPDYS